MQGYEDYDLITKIIRNFWDISHILRQTSNGRGSRPRILTILLQNGEITQSALTARLGIKPGSASETLSKMENAGLICREESKVDRRTVDIKLTDCGKAKAELAFAEREQRNKKMLSSLSLTEQTQLLAILEKLTADWKIRYGQQEKREKRQK